MKTKFLKLAKHNPHEVEAFVEVLFHWRTYGICIPSSPQDLQIEYGDHIIKFEDGTYGSMTPKELEKYESFITS